MAERQKLYRRLKLARIAAQVRELIKMQARVQVITLELPALSLQPREERTLTTLQDETDVVAMYGQLVAALNDVREWGGQAGAGASEGLRILKAGQVTEELREAIASLRSGNYSGSAESQERVIKALASVARKGRGNAGANEHRSRSRLENGARSTRQTKGPP